MDETRNLELFTIERTPARTRLLLRHDPALFSGPLAPAGDRARALRRLARAVAGRLNEERLSKGWRLRRSDPPSWLPLLAQQPK